MTDEDDWAHIEEIELAQMEIDDLKAERDEWKAKCERAKAKAKELKDAYAEFQPKALAAFERALKAERGLRDLIERSRLVHQDPLGECNSFERGVWSIVEGVARSALSDNQQEASKP